MLQWSSQSCVRFLWRLPDTKLGFWLSASNSCTTWLWHGYMSLTVECAFLLRLWRVDPAVHTLRSATQKGLKPVRGLGLDLQCIASRRLGGEAVGLAQRSLHLQNPCYLLSHRRVFCTLWWPLAQCPVWRRLTKPGLLVRIPCLSKITSPCPPSWGLQSRTYSDKKFSECVGDHSMQPVTFFPARACKHVPLEIASTDTPLQIPCKPFFSSGSGRSRNTEACKKFCPYRCLATCAINECKGSLEEGYMVLKCRLIKQCEVTKQTNIPWILLAPHLEFRPLWPFWAWKFFLRFH